MSKKTRANILLLIAAIIWGASFVAQVSGMEFLGPFSFNGLRLILGGISLIPVIKMFSKKNGGECSTSCVKGSQKGSGLVYVGGVVCGLALFVASSLQQVGLQYTTAGKGGFITALYVVIVPIFSFIFLKKRARALVWVSVIIATVGLYLLSIKGADLSIQKGDFLMILCAFVFTLHILFIAHFSPNVDGIKMSSIQFFVAGTISLIVAIFIEIIRFEYIQKSLIPILYSGILSAGVGYTLQIVAQRDTDPTIASLLLSLESVFAVIAGAILLGESMTVRELLGCFIMFVAIVLSQIADSPLGRRKKLIKNQTKGREN